MPHRLTAITVTGQLLVVSRASGGKFNFPPSPVRAGFIHSTRPVRSVVVPGHLLEIRPKGQCRALAKFIVFAGIFRRRVATVDLRVLQVGNPLVSEEAAEGGNFPLCVNCQLVGTKALPAVLQ